MKCLSEKGEKREVRHDSIFEIDRIKAALNPASAVKHVPEVPAK